MIVVANSAGSTTGTKGVRIFSDPTDIGDVGSCWNQHSFHVTNVLTGFGMIPQSEAASWASTPPARNTYRVQSW